MTTKTAKKTTAKKTTAKKTTSTAKTAKTAVKTTSKKEKTMKVYSKQSKLSICDSDLSRNESVGRKVVGRKVVKKARGKKAVYGGTMRQIETGSIGGKIQQRTVGTRTVRNAWGHFEGTIGSKIDSLINQGIYTKKEIEVLGGTKMSKVNSHIAHLRKEKGFDVVLVAGKVMFK